MEDRIRERAFERYIDRGSVHGHDMEDWFAARADILTALTEEKDGGYLFEVPMPGLNANQVELLVGSRSVAVRVPLRNVLNNQDQDGQQLPAPVMQIMRMIEVPTPIDVTNVRGVLQNGILQMTVQGVQPTADRANA